MLIDVHAHLNDEKLMGNIPQILQNAKENGIEKIICVGCDLETSKSAVEIAEKYANVFACIGIHPEYAEDFKESDLKIIENLASSKKVVAIGEIGLDYHYLTVDNLAKLDKKILQDKIENNNDINFYCNITSILKEKQKNMFVKQLELADKLSLPIQIHSRDATGDTMEILQTHKHLLKNSGILHCYSGSLETLKEVEKLGLKISLGGILTFKNARQTIEIAEKMPLEMLTFETDCPYLAPTPLRSTINEPKNILLTAEKFAEIRQMSLGEISKISYQNTLSLFPKMT